ncbi:hypothetical protein [Flavisolibacter ginsenosidimutans]|uniref:Glycosyltransferase RgtA/B/C/D-like domain-containing protein n=1 Tax=Flavisolibacter ginsenosidimutans TaxID=661481 RepID=A0A5B8ULC1_9BACT|nr:hypothetical protein [Flavisolibacter ginsenosidimutans]QEC57358.1 hypothetical protein FSB75_16100 [Flavisolibacter ginsenosidimutans]
MAEQTITSFLQSFYDSLHRFADAFSRRRFWKLYLALLCSVYCILTNIPQYTALAHGQSRGIAIWHRIDHQIDHPFAADTSNDPESHEARLTFRLTGPLLGKLLPTSDFLQRMKGLFVIQNLCGILFFYLLVCFAERHFQNRLASFLLPWCFAVLYAGKTFFCDTIFFFDGLAYLSLLAAVCTRKPLLVFAAVLLAFFTDERALIGSGFVLLCHVLQNRGQKNRMAVVAVISAVVAYAALRFFLQWRFGLYTPSSDVHILNTAYHTYFGYLLLGAFTAFKAFWLVLILGLFLIRGFWPRTIYAGTLALVTLGGISVFDFSRSISYGFVGLLAVLLYLYRQRAQATALNKLLLVLFAVSFLYPVYDVHRHELFITRSPLSKYLETKYTPMPGDRNASSILEQSTH